MSFNEICFVMLSFEIHFDYDSEFSQNFFRLRMPHVGALSHAKFLAWEILCFVEFWHEIFVTGHGLSQDMKFPTSGFENVFAKGHPFWPKFRSLIPTE